MRVRGDGRMGLTFVELAITAALIGILATAAFPVAKVATRRRAELELRRSLREVRLAIDRYVEDRVRREPALARTQSYPRDLDELVRARYLRRVPRDPLTGAAQWRQVGTADPPEASDLSVPSGQTGNGQLHGGFATPSAPEGPAAASTAGPNGLLFDLRSTSEDMALDGTAYKDW